MAYVNSGIAMKNTYYDWRIIILIALFLGVVTVLVILKLLYPDLEPQTLFSTVSPSASVTAAPANTVTPARVVAAVTSPAVTAPASSAPATVNASTAEAINAITPARISKAEAPTTSPPPMERPVVAATENTQPVRPATNVSATSGIVCAAEDREAQLCR